MNDVLSTTLTVLGTAFAILAGGLAVAAAYRPRTLKKRDKHSTVRQGVTRNPGETEPRVHHACAQGLSHKPHPDVTTLYENFVRAAHTYPQRRCFGYRELVQIVKENVTVRNETKTWEFQQLSPYKWLTFEDAGKKANLVSQGLLELGMKPKSNLAIYHETCFEWSMSAIASYAQSIVVLTVYANLGDEALVHALNQGEISTIQTQPNLLATLYKLKSQLPHLSTIIVVGKPTADDQQKRVQLIKEHNLRVLSYDELCELGQKRMQKQGITDEMQKRQVIVTENRPQPEDLAVIMYTSGSTALPKGVLITHRSMIAAVSAAAEIIANGDQAGDVYCSYLPLAHVLALVVENVCICFGVQMGYGSPRSLVDTAVRNCKGDLRELRPTIFAGVPTVYDRVRQGALAKIEKGSPVVRFLFKTAYKAKAAAVKDGRDTPFWNKLVLNKLRDAMGGRVRLMVSGGAPLAPSTHEFLRVCFSAPVLQGYGLTETCGAGAIQLPNDPHNSRVGPPKTCCEIKLVDVPDMNYTSDDQPHPRGEIWMRGAHITSGYYKQSDKTAESFVDGWFVTGDIGQWNPDGTLSIIDRKKNLIKPPHGEYVAIEKLESYYKNSKFIDNLLVYVDGEHNECVGLAAANRPAIMAWVKENASALSQSDPSFEQACEDSAVRRAVLQDTQQIARQAGLKSFEFLRNIFLTSHEWTPDNSHLTAALKLNRPELLKMYRGTIDQMYNEL